MKIEANTLQEAFQKAAEQLNCSVTQLDIKVLQHPSSGFLGFFKRSAIIEANLENQPKPQHKPKNDKNFVKKNDENEAIKEDKKQAKNTIIVIKSEALKNIEMKKAKLNLSKKNIKMKSQI